MLAEFGTKKKSAVAGDLEAAGVTDVNLPASALKAYFRGLDEPVLTNAEVDALGEARIVSTNALRKAVHALPRGKFFLFRYLFEFLELVAANADKNKMTAPNLAVVFGPSLLPNASSLELSIGVVRRLVDDFGFIFSPARSQGTGDGD